MSPEASEPEITRVSFIHKRSHDQILLEDLQKRMRQLVEVSHVQVLEELESEMYLNAAILLIERMAVYLERQADKLRSILKGQHDSEH